MKSFVAIDVETANNYPTSVCSIGAVKVEDGIVTDTLYRFVKPYPNYYFRHFTEEIHGISRRDTDTEPTFPQVWRQFISFIGRLPLVAHNKAFDEKCIRACHAHYGIPYPDYPFFCSLTLARRTISRAICGSFSLPHLCHFFGIPFHNHHNALADAEACAKLFLALSEA